MMVRRVDEDSVDWSALDSVNGPEIPGLLRQIWIGDTQGRQAAYERLDQLLIDQGSRFATAVAAVPFFVELVADPAGPDRFAALQMLLRLAIGDEERWWAARPDMTSRRRDLHRRSQMSLEELQPEADAWVAAGATEQDRKARAARNKYADLQMDVECERWEIEAYDAVRAGVSVYLDVLRDPHPGVRLYAAHLLAHFPEDRSVIVPALVQVLADESTPPIVAVACVAAGMCGEPDDQQLIEAVSAHQGSPDPVVRCSVVIGLASLLRHPDRSLIEALYDCVLDEVELEAPWPYLDGDVSAVAAWTAAQLPADSASDRVGILVSLLTHRAGAHDPFMLGDALLQAAFPHGPVSDGTSWSDLTDDQRTAVAALQRAGLADDTMISMLLARTNLPSNAVALEAWMRPAVDGRG